MELVSDDVEALHCGFADLDALLVAAGVEGAFDFQAGLGARRSTRPRQGDPSAAGRASSG
jgi:hypothetical protein